MVIEASTLYQQTGDTWIETYTGGRFNMNAPSFDRNDIAHALSLNCRYNGHCRSFYSVAEHSVLVSELVRLKGGTELQQLEALLHDGTEAYLSDIPAPFKQFLPDWKAIDAMLDSKFREWAGLPAHKDELVKHCDWIALFIEVQDLLPGKGQDWQDPINAKDEALLMRATHSSLRAHGWIPLAAKHRLLSTWERLDAARLR